MYIYAEGQKKFYKTFKILYSPNRRHKTLYILGHLYVVFIRSIVDSGI